MCFAPVLTMSEAAEHPHNVERKTFIEVGGRARSPRPHPASAGPARGRAARRRTPASTPARCCSTGGWTADVVDGLLASGAAR